MLFGLGNILLVALLLINAIAVLSEDRFLARIGWSTATVSEPTFGGSSQHDSQSVKAKLVSLIASVRTLLRIPLIAANTIVIIYMLILG